MQRLFIRGVIKEAAFIIAQPPWNYSTAVQRRRRELESN